MFGCRFPALTCRRRELLYFTFYKSQFTLPSVRLPEGVWECRTTLLGIPRLRGVPLSGAFSSHERPADLAEGPPGQGGLPPTRLPTRTASYGDGPSPFGRPSPFLQVAWRVSPGSPPIVVDGLRCWPLRVPDLASTRCSCSRRRVTRWRPAGGRRPPQPIHAASASRLAPNRRIHDPLPFAHWRVG